MMSTALSSRMRRKSPTTARGPGANFLHGRRRPLRPRLIDIANICDLDARLLLKRRRQTRAAPARADDAHQKFLIGAGIFLSAGPSG